MVNCNLQLTGGDAANNRAAAMWAAANPEQFEEAKAAGDARTVGVTNIAAPTPPPTGPSVTGWHPRVAGAVLFFLCVARENPAPHLHPPF